MSVSYRHACRFHGQMVIAHTIDGNQHVGIVRRITPREIWLERMSPGVAMSNDSNEPNIVNAINADPPDVETVQFFNPFFRNRFLVLPLFTLLALSTFRRRRRFFI